MGRDIDVGEAGTEPAPVLDRPMEMPGWEMAGVVVGDVNWAGRRSTI